MTMNLKTSPKAISLHLSKAARKINGRVRAILTTLMKARQLLSRLKSNKK
jgi:hypothetical protein